MPDFDTRHQIISEFLPFHLSSLSLCLCVFRLLILFFIKNKKAMMEKFNLLPKVMNGIHIKSYVDLWTRSDLKFKSIAQSIRLSTRYRIYRFLNSVKAFLKNIHTFTYVIFFSLSAKLLSDHRNPLSEKEISQICRATHGYSCSDITSLAREAALGPLRELGPEKLKTVTAEQIRPIQVFEP